MKAYCGSGGIAPLILDLGTRWRWVVAAIKLEAMNVTDKEIIQKTICRQAKGNEMYKASLFFKF
jgi:hypothetical protein